MEINIYDGGSQWGEKGEGEFWLIVFLDLIASKLLQKFSKLSEYELWEISGEMTKNVSSIQAL